MKHKLYKYVITFIALCSIGSINAQKFDKKFTEKFKVNKNVEVAINASNTDINVATWNKNEVLVEAFIEIEGISKKEAEKYFKNWNFEALGNSKTVKITSKNDFNFSSSKDFIFFNDMDFTFPDIKMPNIEAIVIPEMNFDFDFDFENIFEDIEDLDDNMGKDGKYSFQWNDGVDKITIKSKKEWEAFKKTKKYKELKEKMKVSKEKLRKKFAISKEKMKKQIEKAKIEIKHMDNAKIKKSLKFAKEKIEEMKLNHPTYIKSGKLIIDGKEIKIKKRLEIKVPKGATFDLNTRHCKVKLPNTVASGNVKYGSFDANNLNGGKLTIDYSSVIINDLNACNLFLNNVTDAKIASVTNTTMSNNSSGVIIKNINQDVDLFHKYGELTIKVINPNFNSLKLHLNYSDATLPIESLVTNMKVDTKKTKFLFGNHKQNYISKMFTKMAEDENSIFNGKITSDKKTNNLITLNANYSVLNIN